MKRALNCSSRKCMSLAYRKIIRTFTFRSSMVWATTYPSTLFRWSINTSSMFGQILPNLLAYLVVAFNMQTSLAMIMSILAYQTSTENESGIITFALFDRFFSGEFLSLVLACCAMISVFSTFYSFIRLVANKRIEYKVGWIRFYSYSWIRIRVFWFATKSKARRDVQ